MIQVQRLEESRKRLLLEVHGTNSFFLNGLRRTILAFVPSLAIDRVEILSNTAMNDEMLGQRLSMLPVAYTMDKLKSMTYPSECKCETGCDKCCVKLTLNYTNNNHEGDTTEVTDLDLVSKDPEIIMASRLEKGHSWWDNRLLSPPAFPYDDRGITIAKVNDGERIELNAYVRKGRPLYHVKFEPGIVVYRHILDVRVDQTLLNEARVSKAEKEKIVACCPSKVFEVDDMENLIVKRPVQCTRCRQCFQVRAEILRGKTRPVSRKHVEIGIEGEQAAVSSLGSDTSLPLKPDGDQKKQMGQQQAQEPIDVRTTSIVSIGDPELISSFRFAIQSIGTASARDILSLGLEEVKRLLMYAANANANVVVERLPDCFASLELVST